MIRCGLAINDIGFILVKAMYPTSSLSQLVTLFLSLGARSLLWGYKREGVRWGVQEVQSYSGAKGQEREMGAPMCTKYLSVCSIGVVRWVFESIESILVVKIIPLLERAHPLL